MDLEEIEGLYEQDKENAKDIWEKGLEKGKNRRELEKAYKSKIEKIRFKYYSRMSRYINKNKEKLKAKKENPKKEEKAKNKKKSKLREKIKNIWDKVSFGYNVKKSRVKTRFIGPELMYKIVKIKYFIKRFLRNIKKLLSLIIDSILKVIKNAISKISSFFGRSYHRIISIIKLIISKIKKSYEFFSKKTAFIRRALRIKNKPKKEDIKEKPKESDSAQQEPPKSD